MHGSKMEFYLDPLSGTQYQQFIKWACARSDVAMLVYWYRFGRTLEETAYNAQLDSIRESLKPFLLKDVNSVGDYPDKYIQNGSPITREKCPETFERLNVDQYTTWEKMYRWPGGGRSFVISPELGNGQPPDIYIQYYHMTPEVEAVLLSAKSFKEWNYPTRPEDPCFFRDGKCWFVSTVHEEMYTLMGTEKEVCPALDKMGIEYYMQPQTHEWSDIGMPK